MVDRVGLENRYTRKGIEGSNPSLSARLPSRDCLQLAVQQQDHLTFVGSWVGVTLDFLGMSGASGPSFNAAASLI